MLELFPGGLDVARPARDGAVELGGSLKPDRPGDIRQGRLHGRGEEDLGREVGTTQ